MKLPALNELNLSNMSKRERLLVAAGGLVVVLLLMDWFVLGPWWRHMRHVQHEIQRLETSIAKYQQLMSRQPHLAAEAERYRPYLSDPSAQPADMAVVLGDIEAMGDESGLAVGGVKPIEGEEQGLYQRYAVDVQYRGSMEQWLHFLYLLDNSKALLDLERATVAVKNEDGVIILEGSVRVSGRILRHASST